MIHLDTFCALARRPFSDGRAAQPPSGVPIKG